MSEKTRKGLVFGLLILVLVWAYFNFSGPGAKKNDRTSRMTGRTSGAPVSRPAPAIAKAITDSICREYESKPWGKDPFYHWFELPAGSGGPVYSEEVRWHLLGVIFREYQAQALINNHIVTVGDEIEGFRVAEIFRDSVVLKNGDTVVTLRLAKESS